MIFSSGNKYEGDFENGKLSGQGVYTFVDGMKYEGGFKNSKYEGEGTLTYPANCKDCPKKAKRGVWAGGKLLHDYDNELPNKKDTTKESSPAPK